MLLMVFANVAQISLGNARGREVSYFHFNILLKTEKNYVNSKTCQLLYYISVTSVLSWHGTDSSITLQYKQQP